jgi:hypothetical protein
MTDGVTAKPYDQCRTSNQQHSSRYIASVAPQLLEPTRHEKLLSHGLPTGSSATGHLQISSPATVEIRTKSGYLRERVFRSINAPLKIDVANCTHSLFAAGRRHYTQRPVDEPHPSDGFNRFFDYKARARNAI